MKKTAAVTLVAWAWLTAEGQWEVYSYQPSLIEGGGVGMVWGRIPCKSGEAALTLRDRLNERVALEARA